MNYTTRPIQLIENTKKIIDNSSKKSNNLIITGGDIKCLA